MESFLHAIDHLTHEIGHILHTIVPLLSHILELIGAFIIVFGICQATYHLARGKFKLNNHNVKVTLASSLMLALDFMLFAEILNTIMVETFSDLIILLSICGMRIAVGFVLHWELKHHKEELHH